jgi:hypothetical protein
MMKVGTKVEMRPETEESEGFSSAMIASGAEPIEAIDAVPLYRNWTAGWRGEKKMRRGRGMNYNTKENLDVGGAERRGGALLMRCRVEPLASKQLVRNFWACEHGPQRPLLDKRRRFSVSPNQMMFPGSRTIYGDDEREDTNRRRVSGWYVWIKRNKQLMGGSRKPGTKGQNRKLDG